MVGTRPPLWAAALPILRLTPPLARLGNLQLALYARSRLAKPEFPFASTAWRPIPATACCCGVQYATFDCNPAS